MRRRVLSLTMSVMATCNARSSPSPIVTCGSGDGGRAIVRANRNIYFVSSEKYGKKAPVAILKLREASWTLSMNERAQRLTSMARTIWRNARIRALCSLSDIVSACTSASHMPTESSVPTPHRQPYVTLAYIDEPTNQETQYLHGLMRIAWRNCSAAPEVCESKNQQNNMLCCC